ncbi:MAG: PocR ligand-binding domain-containing protein [Sedimentisphaerales bacterium]
MKKFTVEAELLLPHGSKGRKLTPLYEWLSYESIADLINAYYNHDPEDVGRPNGFVCATSFNLLRTSLSQFTKYCEKIRGCKGGRKTCVLSDYYASVLSIENGRPILYSCGNCAYDIVIPLWSKELKKVVGVFIDGQLRPRIPLLADIDSLSDEYRINGELSENYLSMPVLNQQRAHTIRSYLCGDFADKLEFYNRRTKTWSGDLDIETFRKDAIILGGLLDRAASDGVVKQIWELLGERSGLEDYFSAAPVLSTSSVEPSNSSVDPYLDVSFRQPMIRRLWGGVATGYGEPEARAFKDASMQLGKSRILKSKEDKLLMNILGGVSRKCYEPVCQWYKGSSRESHLPLYWLASGVRNGDYIGLLSVAGRHERDLEPLCEKLDVAAAGTRAYLERYSLATDLTRGYGTADNRALSKIYRRHAINRAKSRIEKITKEPERQLFPEWQPLLKNVCYVLDLFGTPGSLPDSERRLFDDCVVTALATPYYSPIAELRASRWLRQVKGRPGKKVMEKAMHSQERQPEFGRIVNYDEQMKTIEEEFRWFEEHQKGFKGEE